MKLAPVAAALVALTSFAGAAPASGASLAPSPPGKYPPGSAGLYCEPYLTRTSPPPPYEDCKKALASMSLVDSPGCITMIQTWHVPTSSGRCHVGVWDTRGAAHCVPKAKVFDVASEVMKECTSDAGVAGWKTFDRESNTSGVWIFAEPVGTGA